MKAKLQSLPVDVSAARLPTWDGNSLVKRSCPVCTSTTPIFFCKRPDNLDVSYCSKCGMFYLEDILSEEELKLFYESYCGNKGYVRTKKNFLKLFIGATQNFHINILENTGGIKGRKILEIGSAYGEFLQYCRYRLAKVFAVEVDPDAREYISKLGFNVNPEICKEHTFDVVCAFNVLEHLRNPDDMIMRISDVLAYDGRLIISVPNANEIIKFGDSWIGFRVDMEHINYFDLKSLCTLLSKHNLFVEQYWEHDQPNIQRAISETFSRSLLAKLAEKSKNFVSSCLCLMSGIQPHRSSDGSFMLTILARKL